MFKKIFTNTYVQPLAYTLILPIFVLVGVFCGFVGGLREVAKATLNACDAILN